MTKRMLIDATHAEETRVVVLDGTRLEDFDVETSTKRQLKGNIYLAKVVRVEPSLQAAFVEYGGNRHGFLAFSEIHPDYYQIPVADRQRLIEMQAEDARREEEEEDLEIALTHATESLQTAPHPPQAGQPPLRPDPAAEDRTMEDPAVEDRGAEDLAVEDRAPEDLAVDDRAPEDLAPEDLAPEDRTAEDWARPSVPLRIAPDVIVAPHEPEAAAGPPSMIEEAPEAEAGEQPDAPPFVSTPVAAAEATGAGTDGDDEPDAYENDSF